MRNGKGAIVSKERGRKRVIKHYISEFKRRNDALMSDFVIIGYTSDIMYAENLKNQFLKETGYEGDIYTMQMGVAVGTHVGLGGLSFYFIEKDRKRDGLIVNEMQNMIEKKNGFVRQMQGQSKNND